LHLSDLNSKIYVAGHSGLVGSAVTNALREAGYTNLLLRLIEELDLRVQADVFQLFEKERPEFVVLAAARVGGILANDSYPADFIGDNLTIQTNIIQAAHHYDVKRLVFLGSSCIYPKLAPQPLKEEYLLTSTLESTNQWYAIAKIAGLKMCEAYHKQHGDDFISIMPTNLYGPGDNFDLQTSHVLPALIRKFYEAKGSGQKADTPVTLWGTGAPRREFLYNKDLADAVLFVLRKPEDSIRKIAPDRMLNIGVGKDIEIRELAELIRDVIGSDSPIEYDTDKPDGTPRKLMDVSRMKALGWKASISLREGLERTYAWYVGKATDDERRTTVVG